MNPVFIASIEPPDIHSVNVGRSALRHVSGVDVVCLTPGVQLCSHGPERSGADHEQDEAERDPDEPGRHQIQAADVRIPVGQNRPRDADSETAHGQRSEERGRHRHEELHLDAVARAEACHEGSAQVAPDPAKDPERDSQKDHTECQKNESSSDQRHGAGNLDKHCVSRGFLGR